MQKVPQLLRFWFVVHFAVDIFFAIPLFIFPTKFLSLFGLEACESVTSHLLGAALLAIGSVSLLVHQKGRETFLAMLHLKLIWSATAAVVVLIALIQGAGYLGWIVFAIFIFFTVLWAKYKIQLSEKKD